MPAIRKHLAAVSAELCLAQGLNAALHSMLLTIHSCKSPQGEIKLKASPRALCKLEPWRNFIAKASPTLPSQKSPKLLLPLLLLQLLLLLLLLS